MQHRALNAIQRCESIVGRGTEPLKFGVLFGLRLFEQTKSLTDNLTGVAEAPGSDPALNEAVEVVGQAYVARWPAWTLTFSIS